LGREKVLGLALLTLTTALWGTSFSFIKLSVENVSSVTYTSYRCLLSVAPLALAKGLRRGFDRGSYRRGLAIGVASRNCFGFHIGLLGVEVLRPKEVCEKLGISYTTYKGLR
jgi:drug/metabolite transporter (DMT)-like permease